MDETPPQDEWLLSPHEVAEQPPPSAEPDVIASVDAPASRTRGILVGAGLGVAGLVAGVLGTFALNHHDDGTTTIRNASDATQQQAPDGFQGQPGQGFAPPDGGGGGYDGEQRLAGRLTKVGTSSLTVRTAGGTATYQVTDQTQIIRNGRLAKLSDLKAGDMVFLHVYPSGGTTVVERVFAGTLPQRGFGGPPGMAPGQQQGQAPVVG